MQIIFLVIVAFIRNNLVMLAIKNKYTVAYKTGNVIQRIIQNSYGVFFSTKKFALYFKKCNFAFVS